MKNYKSIISLWLVLFVIFLDWMGIGLVYPMFSSMLFNANSPLVDANASDALRGWYLGILLSAMSIAQFFSGPALGTLSDQKGRKPIFLLSLSLGVIGYACSMIGVVEKSLGILIASRVLVGIAAGNSAVVSAVVADLSDQENKTKNFGLYSMACGVGFTVGPFLGGKFSEVDFSVPFLIAGLATLANLLLIFIWFKETHLIRKKVSIRWHDGILNLQKAFKIQSLRALFLTILIFCFGWSFFYEFIPVTWISDYKFDPAQVGFFYAYGAAFYALSSGLLIRPIVNKFRNDVILFYGLCSLGTILLVLLVGPGSEWIWVYLPIFNFLAALIFPTYTAMVSDCAGKDAQGEILGISQSIQSVSFAVSPILAGFLLGANPHMPMLLGGISMLLAATILGVLLRKEIFSKSK